MQASLVDGALQLTNAGATGVLSVLVYPADAAEGETATLVAEGDGWRADHACAAVRLRPEAAAPGSRRQRLRVAIATRRPVRVELALALRGVDDGVFHILPGTIFGDNNLAVSGAGHFPNLTRENIDSPSCSPRWELRTDRHAAPVALALHERAYAAIAGPPYIDLAAGFVHTGLAAALPAGVGFAVGYRNGPRHFVNKDVFAEPTADLLPMGAEIEYNVDIFLGAGGGRHAAFSVAREVYDLSYQPPRAGITADECIRAISQIVVEDSWDAEHRVFVAQQAKGMPGEVTYRKVGGRAIAWVGGANVAFPLLAAGYRLDDRRRIDVGAAGLDRIAEVINPDSGLFFDAFDGDWRPGVNYWWSGMCNKDRHSAYTNAEAAWYLLKGDNLVQRQEGRDVADWREAALCALDTMLTLQRDDGNFGYAYRTDRPEVADWNGFAGCWFVPAMALAHRLTGERGYLESARRGLDYYAAIVRTLDVWGTPMDTWKGNDEEGVLAFLRGAALLHRITGDDRYLEMMRLGADYEFLWRYLYNTRPDAEPLRSAGWDSCGGSITSVSNPHIHPMGLLIAGDLKYLHERTGDDHVRRRLDDSLVWARNCIELYPEKTGYGRRGWTGERYCPSDGLLVQKYADGSPASTEHGLNLWAASAFLEGMLDTTLMSG